MKSQLLPVPSKSLLPLASVLCALLGMCSFAARAGLALPEVPLQTGSALPANIWFILDDSGSMADTEMPDTLPSISTPSGFNFASQTFTRNSIYYNPFTTYQPWRNWDGSFLPVTAPTAAFTSTILASGATTNLTTSNWTYYVPKAGITNLADGTQYWRYRLLTTRVIERRELTFASGSWAWRNPANLTSVTWDTPNGPVTRSFAQEMQNFATWYSYARTRTKVAKGGASAAFSGLGEDVRVGFTSIWNRSTLDIPVQADGGLFRNANRSTWFNRLHTATASGSTPLRNALTRAGQYFSRTDADGPYGPEPTNQQLACRQNFSILTTDGFWNGTSPGTPNVDGANGPTITGPNNPPFQYSPVRPYRDDRADTLADVGMNNWVRDLRPDLPNIVPTSAADPAFWQHSVTFGISIGLRGTLNPETDLPALTTGALSWPPPAANSINNIDDLWHAAVNGRGEFVAATDPQAFSDGLRDALATITARVGSSSNASTNTSSISSNSQVFLASFIGGQWTGELSAFRLTAAGASTAPNWLASQGIPAFAARRIFTWSTSGTPAGATFPTPAQTTALGGSQITNFLRGDSSNEQANGGSLRDRRGTLGDIVDSSPIFVGDVANAVNDTVYVGANDGMLHAIDANTGVERFAYIPGGVNLANLKTLSNPDYAHRYFVDGPIVVSNEVQTPGRRVLVGAMGRGGRGLYALDVTDPANFAANKVKWDISSDTDFGNMLGQPFITKLNNGRTAVVFGNGPNSASDHAILILVDIETGAIIRKIDTGPLYGSAAMPNGLSGPRGFDLEGDGVVDMVYAGDLQGNVWKFDLRGALPANWKVSNSITPNAPLYSAKNPAGVAQPITGRIALAVNPETFQVWMFFGTGRYLTNGDPADLSVQSWYGIQDAGITIPSVVNRTAPANQLKAREIAVVGTVNGAQVRAFEEPVDGDMLGKMGWVLDLLNPPSFTAAGERMVGDSFLFGTALVAASIIPSSDPCEVGGTGFFNAIEAFTGASLAASIFDVDGDQDFSDDTLPNPSQDPLADPIAIGSFNPGVGMPNGAVVIAVGPGSGGSPPVCTDPADPACPCDPADPSCDDGSECPPGTNLGLVPGSNGPPAREICIATRSGQGRVSWREVIRD